MASSQNQEVPSSDSQRVKRNAPAAAADHASGGASHEEDAESELGRGLQRRDDGRVGCRHRHERLPGAGGVSILQVEVDDSPVPARGVGAFPQVLEEDPDEHQTEGHPQHRQRLPLPGSPDRLRCVVVQRVPPSPRRAGGSPLIAHEGGAGALFGDGNVGRELGAPEHARQRGGEATLLGEGEPHRLDCFEEGEGPRGDEEVLVRRPDRVPVDACPGERHLRY